MKAQDPNNPISTMPVSQPGQVQAPGGVDTTQEDLAKQQQDYAKQFRANIGGYEQQAFNPIEQQAKVGLARQMGQIKTSANRRGLLYSGLRQGAEADAQSQTAQALQNKRAEINQSFGGAADQFDQQALKAGLDIQAGQQAIQDILYNRALANYQGRNAAIGSGLGAIGTIGGKLLAGGL